MKNRIRFIVSTLIFLIGVISTIVIGINVLENILNLTVEDLFISFTLIPMLLTFLIPFLSTFLLPSKRTKFASFIFCIFVYMFNYIFIDSFFTLEIIEIIYSNSNLLETSVSVTSSTDVGSMISTIIMILGLCAFAVSLASALAKKVKSEKMVYG